MDLKKITLSEQAEFGAVCFASERNKANREDHDRELSRANSLGANAHREAERLALSEHNDKQREAHDAHTGDEPFAFVMYAPGEPFAPDETPFEPRSIEDLVGVALTELLESCAQRVLHRDVEEFTRFVMGLPYADRRAAIDALPGSKD